MEPLEKFCSHCGAQTQFKIPDGDNRLRQVCDSCHTIHYKNPNIVTGTLPVYGDKVLLCRRAIEPRKGFWTLPAGFMELGETVEGGALRETVEEAGAQVVVESLYTLFNLPEGGQVSMFFLATMDTPEFSAGVESIEVALFAEDEIPWDELSFMTVRKTLEYFFADRKTGHFPLHVETLHPPK